uniref:GRIP domain-containing protein n=1 Tax=Heterorhabditis bacteriophora TaxID=37862 RepID=A0A1I7WQA6_HETBA
MHNSADELDRIHLVVAQATDVPEGEVPYLLQQIQVLEAGKSMVTQRMLEFEKENTQLKRSLENGQQERAEIMSKLKQLSGQIRNLTDDCEGNKVEKEVIGKELAKYKLNNEHLERKISDLNKMLDQRPSEDDVTVLRTELVHAQKLMDEISQQKDVEIQEHLNSIRQLNMEREKQHCALENLQKQVKDGSVVSRGSQERVEFLSVELKNTCQLLETCKKDLNIAVEEVVKKEKRIVELQMRVDANVSELTACREKISQLEETVRLSGREIDDSHFFNEKNQEKLLQLSKKLEQMIEDKKRYELDLCGFEEKQEAQADNIKVLELANMDLTNELSSFGSLLEQERQRITEKNAMIKSKDQDLYCLKDQLNEYKKNVDRLKSEMKEKELKISELTMEVSILQDNSKELMIKVAEGEGGAKIVIDQLSEEKKKLQEDITAFSIIVNTQACYTSNKDEYLAKIDLLDKKLYEVERTAEGKIKKLEEEKEELEQKCRESEEEINRKAERFVEMERESEEERRKTSERVGKLKELIKQKECSAYEMRKQIDELSTQVADRDRMIREKERHLEENKVKIEESVKHLEEAEAKARKLESDLLESESQREVGRGSEFDLKLKLMETEAVLEEYKQKTEKLTGELRDSQAEFDIIEKDSREKEEHWRIKREEFERQMEKNQEANDELIGNMKDLQEQINGEKLEKLARELKISNFESKIEETSRRINDLETEVTEKEKTIQNLKESLEALVEEIAVIHFMNKIVSHTIQPKKLWTVQQKK